MTRKNFTVAELKSWVVFEDQHLLVIDKPAGLLSQGAEAGDDNLVDLLRVYLGRPYVGLVHRLDRNTSGLMVVAKRTKAAERLTQALQRGELVRKYWALVEGEIAKGYKGKWRHWLKKDETKNKVEVFRDKKADAKEAVLCFECLGNSIFEGRKISWLQLELETGRSHQIRAQASFEGYPLVGDTKYGAKKTSFPRPALHSYFIEFPHPKEGVGLMKFEVAAPDFPKGA